MPTILGTTVLPDDMKWLDEFDWSYVSQQQEVSLGGSLWIEESSQLKGRPITLVGEFSGSEGYAAPTRAIVLELQALCDTPLTDPLLLTLYDGRSFNVRFDYSQGTPVKAEPIRHKAPQINTDLYTLTLRLIEV